MYKLLFELIDHIHDYKDKLFMDERNFNVHLNWIKQAYSLELTECDYSSDKRCLPHQFTKDHQAYPVKKCQDWQWIDDQLIHIEKRKSLDNGVFNYLQYTLSRYPSSLALPQTDIFDSLPKTSYHCNVGRGSHIPISRINAEYIEDSFLSDAIAKGEETEFVDKETIFTILDDNT